MIHIREVIRNGEAWGFPDQMCVGLNTELFRDVLMVRFTVSRFAYMFTAYSNQVEGYPLHRTTPKNMKFGKPGKRVWLRIIPLARLEKEGFEGGVAWNR